MDVDGQGPIASTLRRRRRLRAKARFAGQVATAVAALHDRGSSVPRALLHLSAALRAPEAASVPRPRWRAAVPPREEAPQADEPRETAGLRAEAEATAENLEADAAAAAAEAKEAEDGAATRDAAAPRKKRRKPKRAGAAAAEVAHAPHVAGDGEPRGFGDGAVDDF